MAEFFIGQNKEKGVEGIKYSISKIPARTAFHIVRKLSPVVPALIPLLSAVKDTAALEGREVDGMDIVRLVFEEPHSLYPLANFLHTASDDIVDSIMSSCLSYVQRFQGGIWTDVWNKQANCLQFDDIGWQTMVDLLVRVIKDQFLDFMFGLDTSRSPSPTVAASNGAASPAVKTGS